MIKNSPNDEVDGHCDEAVEEVVAVGEEAGHELPSRPEAVEGKSKQTAWNNKQTAARPVEEPLCDAGGEEGAAHHVGQEEEDGDGSADLQPHRPAYHEVHTAVLHLYYVKAHW